MPSLAQGPSMERPVLASLGVSTPGQDPVSRHDASREPPPQDLQLLGGKVENSSQSRLWLGPLFSPPSKLGPMCCLTRKVWPLSACCEAQPDRGQNKQSLGGLAAGPAARLSAALAFAGFQTVPLNLSQKTQLLPFSEERGGSLISQTSVSQQPNWGCCWPHRLLPVAFLGLPLVFVNCTQEAWGSFWP